MICYFLDLVEAIRPGSTDLLQKQNKPNTTTLHHNTGLLDKHDFISWAILVDVVIINFFLCFFAKHKTRTQQTTYVAKHKTRTQTTSFRWTIMIIMLLRCFRTQRSLTNAMNVYLNPSHTIVKFAIHIIAQNVIVTPIE
jgi:hypothetical protein